MTRDSTGFRRAPVHTPRSLGIRKVLFQVHLWAGIGVGLYVLVASTTGAALVFRGEIQHAQYREFFPSIPAEGSQADIADVVDSMAAAYPDHQVVGVGAPTDEQHTFAGYIFKDEEYRAVYADAVSGAVIGALPEQSGFGWLQNLHFYLLSGTRGLLINGIGGLLLFLLALTGLGIWWPGIAGWTRSLRVDFSGGAGRINRDLHHAVGFWTAGFVAMWALTGAYFAFPEHYRTVIGWFSPLTSSPPVPSDSVGRIRERPANLRDLVRSAGERLPGSQVARVSLPRNDTESVQVVMTRTMPAARENADYVYFYFDQFTGRLLHTRDLGAQSWGNRIMPWFGRIHVGAFGGVGVKIVWFLVGLAPAVLFATGFLMWWRRIVFRRRKG